MDLREYERVKFGLAEILRTVPWDAARAERLRDLFARLAEDRFNLAVVGRFSRGKSSLMNAILGMDRLPTGVVPLTSVITTVTYGSIERVTLHFLGTSLIEDIRLDQLSTYVTERGNPGNVRRIEVADVQLPAAILRHGFQFVDTPGLASSIAENTRTTEAFMPEADALILVTSFDSALSEEEIAMLRSALRLNRRVFIAINKQDAVTAGERAEALAHVIARLHALFGEKQPAVFPLSARDALTAKQTGDKKALADSGLPALEAALVDFLVSGRRQEFLLAMCARVGEMLTGPTATLDALRALIATPGPSASSQPEPDLASDIAPCAVCESVEQGVIDFLMSYQGRLVRDPAARADLADRCGLCGPHTWQFERVAAPREVCTAFAMVLESQAAHLRAEAAEPDRRCDPVGPDGGHCPVCQVAAALEAKAAASLAAQLSISGPVVPRKLSAICLPHLGAVLAGVKDSATRRGLLRRQADLLDRLADDMRRFTLKQDAAQRWALNQEDIGAAKRGSRVLVGVPAAFIPAGERPTDAPGDPASKA